MQSLMKDSSIVSFDSIDLEKISKSQLFIAILRFRHCILNSSTVYGA